MSLTIPNALQPALTSRYLHRPRALFVLRRRADVSRETFEQALCDWRREQKFEAGIIVHAGAAKVEDQEFLSGRFRLGGINVTALDGYVSLDVDNFEPTPADFEKLFKATEGCLGALCKVIDPAESIAFAGVVNLVIPGDAPISMILILDRVKGLTLEQYNQWWVDPHGDDHRRLNLTQIGYHQIHVAPEFNALAAKAAGVSTTERCIIDIMYLARLKDAFSNLDPKSEEARAFNADIGAHVSMATVSGSFMQEV